LIPPTSALLRSAGILACRIADIPVGMRQAFGESIYRRGVEGIFLQPLELEASSVEAKVAQIRTVRIW
jgi:hypothetical protein